MVGKQQILRHWRPSCGMAEYRVTGKGSVFMEHPLKLYLQFGRHVLEPPNLQHSFKFSLVCRIVQEAPFSN